MNQNFPKIPHFQPKVYPHRGILNSPDFEKEVDLQCYEPSLEMAPFVDVYFVARWNRFAKAPYIAVDVLTKPVVNLFFTAGGAFVQGPVTGLRRFTINESGVYAGVKFKPGGFYAFSSKSFADEKVSAELIFPKATPLFNEALLKQSNDIILERIDSLLRHKKPKVQPKLMLVTKVMAAIDADADSRVGSLAQKFAISERTLQQTFKRYVGTGIKQAAMRMRLLRAVEYSLNGKPNWTGVAAGLNYSTQSHFINDFKQHIGVSPSQYLKLVQSHTLEPLTEQDKVFTVVL